MYRARAHHIAIHPAISSFRAASGADTGIFEEKLVWLPRVRTIRACSFERSRAQLRQPRNAVQTDRGALLARVFRKRERSQRHGTALDVCSRIERVLIERQRTRVSRMAGVRGRSNIPIPLSLIIDSYRRSTNIYIYIFFYPIKTFVIVVYNCRCCWSIFY